MAPLPSRPEPRAPGAAPAATRAPPLRFGRFTLLRAERQLLDGGTPVRVGSRVFDLLLALVERAGEVVSKRELAALAWPDPAAVEDNNLRVHVAALRALLGEGESGLRYIVNASGRGYCFVAPVETVAPTAAVAPAPPPPLHNLPAQLSHVIGRDDVIAAIGAQLSRRRFVSVVGAAGMGKTTVALAAAERQLARHADGVRFVDLSSQSDTAGLVAALAGTLDSAGNTPGALPRLLQMLARRRMLIVLDNCDHALEAAAEVAAAVLRGAPGVHVLATSREPLQAAGETVIRLGPLSLPAAGAAPTAAAALQHGSVQLFVERAIASVDSFSLRDGDAETAGEICRRLDGMPLAIELAAAQVQAFGMLGLRQALDDRLRLLAYGYRDGMPRHRTLRALLDWSYDILGEDERRALRRLSVFRGVFTLESARALLAALGGADERVASLVRRSLLSVQVGEARVRYRLLDSTRDYAFEKLVDSGDAPDALRAHALLLCDELEAMNRGGHYLTRTEWMSRHGGDIDDVRAAMDWAFAPGGDTLLAVRLTLSATAVAHFVSLLGEFADRLERGLRSLEGLDPPQPELEFRMRKQYLMLTLQVRGPCAAADEAERQILALADRVGRRLDVLYVLWIAAFGSGRYDRAAEVARQIGALVAQGDDPVMRLTADRVMAQSLHFGGDGQAGAQLAEQVLNHPAPMVRLGLESVVPVDRRISMRLLLARQLALQLRVAEAFEVVEALVALIGDEVAYGSCQALALAACPVALWADRREAARDWIGRLERHALRHELGYWAGWARAFDLVLDARERDAASTAWTSRVMVAPQDGKLADALCTIQEAFVPEATRRRAAAGSVVWCAPEALRVEGVIAARRHDPAAEALLQRACAEAARLQLPAWEVRAANSLAQGRLAAGRRAEARTLLGPLVDRFAAPGGHTDLDQLHRLWADASSG